MDLFTLGRWTERAQGALHSTARVRESSQEPCGGVKLSWSDQWDDVGHQSP